MWSRFIGVVALVLVSAFFSAPAHADKSYRIARVSIDSAVQADGELEVTETRTYRFDGRFSYAFWTQARTAGMNLTNIAVSEGDHFYERSVAERPGTYTIEEDDAGWKVTWHFSAKNETREFTLHYRVTGAVSKYADVGDCYFNFIGDGWSVRQEAVVIDVRLPEPVPTDEFAVWAHGPYWGRVAKTGPGQARASISSLPPRTYFDVRVVFPAELLSNMPATLDEPRREQILNIEAQRAEEANRAREQLIAARARKEELRVTLAWVGGGFVGLVLLIFVPWWARLVRRHPVGQIPREQMDPPTDHCPAEVAYLFSGSQIGGRAMVATLLHLAQRGLFELREEREEVSGFLGTKTKVDYRFVPKQREERIDELAPHERELLDFLFEHAETDGALSMQQLRESARKHRSTFRRWFQEWSQQLAKRYKQNGWWEPCNTGFVVYSVLAMICVVVAGVAYMVYFESPLGMIGVATAILMLIMTLASQRRTPNGRELYLRWRVYRDYLRGLPRLPDDALGTVTTWGDHLCFAVVLGQLKAVTTGLDRTVDRSGGNTHLIPWYYGAFHADDGAGLAGFGAAMSSMVTSMSSTMSSATGAGGGASAGGGGGAGGSGGGAG